jgi:UDPglucose 6-dehydrogenase/GDP-mannose 6-dehydrogenase
MAASLEAAVADADVILLVTRWSEFSRLPDLVRAGGRTPLVIDGRRVLDPASFARYEGIGR